jgi:hypothetical protein
VIEHELSVSDYDLNDDFMEMAVQVYCFGVVVLYHYLSSPSF